MGSDLKTRQGRGSGSGHTKGTYPCQQKCWLYGDFISCPFGAELQSVTNYPLAAIKLVLLTQNIGRQSPPNEKWPNPARSTGAGPGNAREQSRVCEVASTFCLPVIQYKSITVPCLEASLSPAVRLYCLGCLLFVNL